MMVGIQEGFLRFLYLWFGYGETEQSVPILGDRDFITRFGCGFQHVQVLGLERR